MELVFAYAAGLLTLINPCVLPVLPIVLAASLSADPRGPVALALGMALSFILFGMFVSIFGRSIGLSPERLSDIGAVVMIFFGLVLVVPQFAYQFERATAGIALRADRQIDRQDRTHLGGQFIGGALLGAVWSPCIGPTLGGAIALASQGQDLFWVFLIMAAFAGGVATLILAIGWGGQGLLRRRAELLQTIAQRSKPAMGLVFIGVGVMLLTRLHHVAEAWAVRNLPYWLQDLSVAL